MNLHPRTSSLCAALAALTVLTACGAPTADVPVAQPPQTSPAEDATTGAAPDTAPASPDGGPVELSTVHDFGDGLTVSLADLSRATTTATAYPTEAPYLRFTLQWENHSGQQVDLAMVSVTCVVGEDGTSSELVFDSEGGVDSMFDSKLLDGNRATAVFGCEMAPNQTRIQIEVSLWEDITREVIFAGEVE